jgi:hypothetical protein
MIKKTLLILMAIASLTSANSAKAGLGWTLSECEYHYGQPAHQKPTDEYGRDKYLFKTDEYNVVVWLFDGMVTRIIYKRADDGFISLNAIGTLLHANAPKADWSADPEKDSTGSLWWYGQVTRDPFAYEAEYTQDDVVRIFTRADLEMVKAKQSDLAKDF